MNEVSRSGSWRKARNAFLHGATRPSKLSVCVMVAVVLTLLITAAVTVTPAGMAGTLPGYLASWRNDYDAFVTGHALRMAQDSTDAPVLVLLCASAGREAFDRTDLQETLSENGLPETRVYNCGTARQGLVDSIMIADNIPMDTHGVVVLSIGPARFAESKDTLEQAIRSPRLGLHSDALARLAGEQGLAVGRPSGLYVWDHLRFLAPRLRHIPTRLLRNRPLVVAEHRYLRRAPRSPTKAREHSERVAERLSHYDENKAWNEKLLLELVAVVRARPGLQFALIEHPINPDFLRTYMPDGLMSEFRESLRTLAAANDIPILPLEYPEGATAEIFHDWCHLRDREAIRSISRSLGQRVADMLVQAEEAK